MGRWVVLAALCLAACAPANEEAELKLRAMERALDLQAIDELAQRIEKLEVSVELLEGRARAAEQERRRAAGLEN